jgi:FHA domain
VALGVVFLTPEEEPALGVLITGRSASIGRAAGALIRVPEPTVGDRHASLKKRGQVYLIADEGSPNGTLVQARDADLPVRLGADSPRVILAGDRILLGHVAMELFPDAPGDVDREVEWLSDPKEVPRALVRRALERLTGPPSEEVVNAALLELLSSPEELLGAEPPLVSKDEDPGPKGSDDGEGPLLPSPLPVDLALSCMALFLMLVAGAALYRLLATGAVVSP